MRAHRSGVTTLIGDTCEEFCREMLGAEGHETLDAIHRELIVFFEFKASDTNHPSRICPEQLGRHLARLEFPFDWCFYVFCRYRNRRISLRNGRKTTTLNKTRRRHVPAFFREFLSSIHLVDARLLACLGKVGTHRSHESIPGYPGAESINLWRRDLDKLSNGGRPKMLRCGTCDDPCALHYRSFSGTVTVERDGLLVDRVVPVTCIVPGEIAKDVRQIIKTFEPF